MRCKDVHTRLLDYAEGNLSEEEREQVSRHLQECEACSKLYPDMKEAWQMAREENIPHQPFFYTRVRQRLEEERNRGVPASRPAFRTLLQPALFFLVLGLGIAIGIQLGKGVGPRGTITASNQQGDYLESYAQDQYWNGFQIESLEQEFFFTDSVDLSNSLNQQDNSYE